MASIRITKAMEEHVRRKISASYDSLLSANKIPAAIEDEMLRRFTALLGSWIKECEHIQGVLLDRLTEELPDFVDKKTWFADYPGANSVDRIRNAAGSGMLYATTLKLVWRGENSKKVIHSITWRRPGSWDKARIPHWYNMSDHCEFSDPKLLREAVPIYVRRTELKAERDNMILYANKVMSVCNTINQLLTAWPSVIELLPDETRREIERGTERKNTRVTRFDPAELRDPEMDARTAHVSVTASAVNTLNQ